MTAEIWCFCPYGPTSFHVSSQELQIWQGAGILEDTTDTWPWGTGATAKGDTLDVTLPAAGWMGRTQTSPVGVKSSIKACRKISLLSFPCTPVPSHPSDPDAPLHAAERG